MTHFKKDKYKETTRGLIDKAEKEKAELFEKCDFCKHRKDDVKERIDPYNEEINDEITYIKICKNCYDFLIESI